MPVTLSSQDNLRLQEVVCKLNSFLVGFQAVGSIDRSREG